MPTTVFGRTVDVGGIAVTVVVVLVALYGAYLLWQLVKPARRK